MATIPLSPTPQKQAEGYKRQDLLQSINLRYHTLVETFKREGRHQIEYPSSRDGWLRSLFELFFDLETRAFQAWEIFFPLVLGTTLSFMLVFRLNRAADRWWTSRIEWGQIIAISRNLFSVLVTHAEPANKDNRDRVIQWTLTLVIATMEYLRDVKVPPKENFSGMLCEHQFEDMVGVDHRPMYAADQARHYLSKVFAISAETPVGIANRQTRYLEKLENMMDELMMCCGVMERIKATPLPIVYVSHLRTFLLVSLLLMPYAWGPAWGWATIPFVAATSFAWLGIEAASMEAECPFSANRRNALDMDSYCLIVIQGAMQQLQQYADRERKEFNDECNF